MSILTEALQICVVPDDFDHLDPSDNNLTEKMEKRVNNMINACKNKNLSVLTLPYLTDEMNSFITKSSLESAYTNIPDDIFKRLSDGIYNKPINELSKSEKIIIVYIGLYCSL